MKAETQMQSKTARLWLISVVELPLKSPLAMLSFFAVFAILTSIWIVTAVRIAVAERLGESVNLSEAQRAVSLDPSNSALHYNLGRLLLLDVGSGDLERGKRELQEALRLSPHSVVYWSGLGKACYAAGDQRCADSYLTRAAEMAPNRPQLRWDTAVNAVVAGNPTDAVQQLREFLRLQPNGFPEAFQLLMRGFNDPDMIWNNLLTGPQNASAQLQYLEFLSLHDRFDDAQKYWSKLKATGERIPLPDAVPYIDRLLSSRRYTDAAEVWRYAVSGSAVGKSIRGDDGNLAFNGGFERESMNAGFDWRDKPQPYVIVDSSDSPAHSGLRALRVDFTVPANDNYEPLYELVPVIPGQSYQLRGYVRSEGITSDSGPRLRITDPQCPACLDVATEGAVGTSNWHELGLRFTPGEQTRVVQLSIWRPRSRVFPMEISGRAWFDDISIWPAH